MQLTYELSKERPKQIGLIVLQADETLERDMRRILPGEVDCLVSRVPSGASVTSETLRSMEVHLTHAAELFPKSAEFSAIAYGCTSGTAEIGAERIADLIRSGAETPFVTEPVSALIAACRHLGVERIGLITPYIPSVSETLRSVLADNGIATVALASFEEELEEKVARISPKSVQDAAVNVGQNSECQAVFLSCTNLPTLGIIETVETVIGKPVLSSNQVLAWHLSKLGGFDGLADGYGALLRRVTP